MTDIQRGWSPVRWARQRGHGRRRLRSLFLAGALAAGAAAVGVGPVALAGGSPPSLCPDAVTATFGPNVCVVTPTMPQASIQTDLNTIATQQVPLGSQFDTGRYAVLFEPGTYGTSADPLVFEVGYYEEVAGLGAVPQDTVINGQIEVFANAPDSGPDGGSAGQCYAATCYWANSTVNFWRSLSNLTLNVMDSANNYVPQPITQLPPIGDAGNCFGGSNDIWSVSQAAPVRSVIINGSLVFQQYCSETNYQGADFGSGSFVANSEINGQLNWSGNQQGIARNTDMQSAVGYVWNYVYSGDACPPGYTPPAGTACSPTQDAFDDSYTIGGGTDGINGVNQVTELPQSPVSQEPPYLYTTSSGSWDVFVPALEHNSVGPNFVSGTEAGSSLPLSSFFVANPGTSVWAIDAALAQGKNLILTPGVYNLDQPIVVPHPDTIVLGLGFATLVPQHGNAAMIVVRDHGVTVTGLIIDAGPVNSPVLLSVGTPARDRASAGDPDLISDVYFRVGGAETTAVSATVNLLDNADNSIIDDLWAWRADHGANTSVTGPEGQVGAGWTYNRSDTGVIVTGDDVTAYGLAVEHYQKNEVIWSGQNGTAVYFQNELPYDAPSQAAWMATPTQDGYPAFYVTPNVRTFHGYGMGSYVVFTNTPAAAGANYLYDAEAFQAPTTSGVQFTDTLGVWIAGNGGLQSIIDGHGGPDTSITPGSVVPVDVVSYP